MTQRLQTVAETAGFLRDAEAAGLNEAERLAIVEAVARDPSAGDEVRGSGGVRKRRFAGRGKGKSGGYRIMSAWFGDGAPVYLLALLSKGERSNFSPAEIAGFKRLTDDIARHWRKRRMT